MFCFIRCFDFDLSGYSDCLDVLSLLLLFAIVTWMAVRDALRFRKPPRRQAQDALAEQQPQQHPIALPNSTPTATFTSVSPPGSPKEMV